MGFRSTWGRWRGDPTSGQEVVLLCPLGSRSRGGFQGFRNAVDECPHEPGCISGYSNRTLVVCCSPDAPAYL